MISTPQRAQCILASHYSNIHLSRRLRASAQVLLLRILKWKSDQKKKKKRSDRKGAPAGSRSANQQDFAHLMSTVKRGHFKVLQKVLQSPSLAINFDSQDDKGMTLLAWASHLGRGRCAQLLINKGASSYIHDNNDLSPLMLACRGGHPDIVELLLRSGADPYARANWGQGADCLTFAAGAGCVQSIELLLSKGIGGPEMLGEAGSEDDGQHPLLAAAENGHLRALQLLLRSGAKVNRTNKKGRTALLAAAERGDTPMVEVLIMAGAKTGIFEFDDEQKTTPLMAASSRGAEDTVMALLKAPDAVFTIARAIDVCGYWKVRERLMRALGELPVHTMVHT
jgi:ankyrin repeat protein